MGSTELNSCWHEQPGIRKNGKETGQNYNRWGKNRPDSGKWENTKCDFQIEQQTKVKGTTGK